MSDSRIRELEAENQKLSEANHRLQQQVADNKRDKLAQREAQLEELRAKLANSPTVAQQIAESMRPVLDCGE